MSDASDDDVFDRLTGDDGFHVVEVDNGISLALYCQAYAEGRLYNLADPANPDAATALVRRWMGPSETDRAECSRRKPVLQAVARYLRTGGTWDELEGGLRSMSRVAISGLAFPGYALLDTYPTFDADVPDRFVYQHVFVREYPPGRGPLDPLDREARVWTDPTYSPDTGDVFGGYVSAPTTLRDILKAQETDEEQLRRAGGPGAGDDAGAGGPPLPLLGIEDLGPP